MNKKVSNLPAELIPQKDIVQQCIDHIELRRNGLILPLRTQYNDLNEAVMGGFDWNTMLCIAGMSSSGKSTLSKLLIDGIMSNCIVDEKEVVCISFNFEMVAHKAMARQIVRKSRTSLSELYSIEAPIDEYKLKEMKETHFAELERHPIYYVEEPRTYAEISNTIIHYWNTMCKENNKGLIVEIDHALITRGLPGEEHKAKVDQLIENLNVIKKIISAKGGKILFIVIMQMNRDIQTIDRRKNPEMHYPITSDVFASSLVEHYADYLLVIHNPAKLGIRNYGPDNYPVRVSNRKETIRYCHILKNRDGIPDQVLPFLGMLQYYDFEEIPEQLFTQMCKDFAVHKSCTYSPTQLIK